MSEHEQREIELALDKLRPYGKRLIEAGWRAELLVFGPTEFGRLGGGYKAALVLPLPSLNEESEMKADQDEVLGGEEPDDAVDVAGNQEPVDWSREPRSDEGLSDEARSKLTAEAARP
jgi:hypothetical protein